MYFHGHRSGAAEPILWVLGLAFAGVILLLAVLTVTHLKSPDAPVDITPSSVVAPGAPAVPAPSCFPMQAAC